MDGIQFEIKNINADLGVLEARLGPIKEDQFHSYSEEVEVFDNFSEAVELKEQIERRKLALTELAKARKTQESLIKKEIRVTAGRDGTLSWQERINDSEFKKILMIV